jgi:hypothetical protein
MKKILIKCVFDKSDLAEIFSDNPQLPLKILRDLGRDRPLLFVDPVTGSIYCWGADDHRYDLGNLKDSIDEAIDNLFDERCRGSKFRDEAGQFVNSLNRHIRRLNRALKEYAKSL